MYRWLNERVSCSTLVAIGVAILVVLVVTPLFAPNPHKARQPYCILYVQQLATATLAYTQDYDERFPLADSWRDRIDLITQRPELHCPALGQDETDRYGYGFNSNLSAQKIPFKPN